MGIFKRYYHGFLRRFIPKTFRFFEKCDIHISRVECYDPIPDTRTLKDSLWEKHTEMVGVDINLKEQFELLSQFSSKYAEEYNRIPRTKTDIPYQFYYYYNGGFPPVDAEILYCMIRHYKPSKIIEIGSGNTTYLSAQAISENKKREGLECELIAIEPYPNKVLQKGFPGLSRLIVKKVEDVDLELFKSLKENDILFIDSTHVLRTGGDVQYEYLEILPRLEKGVLVQIHDIFTPSEYPKINVKERFWFWNEQYLLQAFLCFNDVFKVLWTSSYMHLNHPDKLENAFASYREQKEKQWPASVWLRRVK